MLSMRIFDRVLYFFIPKPERIISLESSADSGLSGSFRCGTVVVAGEEINYANNLKRISGEPRSTRPPCFALIASA